MRKGGEKYLWILVGAGVGAGVTYFVTSGAARRVGRYLNRVAEEGRERLVETGQDVLERGKDLYERGKEVADDARQFVIKTRRAAAR